MVWLPQPLLLLQLYCSKLAPILPYKQTRLMHTIILK
ncbi:hypothetical protein GLYMA_16G163000v4 [Glycine max]|nr:hypothetical protein GLYMA_16G163000v4 [Glycine max]KAH1151697.1 hypothetical protein GYH30_045274 [Glycine max]